MYIDEVSGVAKAGSVIAITVCRESKEERGNSCYFLTCLTKIEVRVYDLESAR